MTTMRYLIIKLRLLRWIWQAITPDSEAVAMMTGGEWNNSMRDTALEMLLAEVRNGNPNSDL